VRASDDDALGAVIPDDDLRDSVDGVTEVDPVDPDVDLHVYAQRHELDVHPGLVLGAIAVGGVLGSEARYGLTVVFPDGTGVPWTTLAINVLGCLVMGALMVVVRRVGARAPLLRPFAGVGVLGGFTTFSAYTVGVERLLAGAAAMSALAYLAVTPLLAIVAIAIGDRVGRAVVEER
jgi:fluoride exporter